MEYVSDGKGGRIAIPDAVISASTDAERSLVVKYLAASPAEREKIEAAAIAAVTPKEASKEAPKVPASALEKQQ